MSLDIQKMPLGPVEANTYIITDEDTNETAVIDCGYFSPELKDLLKDKNVKYILLTHGHYDHILGVPELKKFTNAPVLIHTLDAACLYDEVKSLNSISGCPAQTKIEADTLLNDGDTIALGNTILSVMHTPGHTKGGVCFVDEADRVIFSGDTLFCLTAGRTDFDGGSFEELMTSLKKIKELDGDYAIYPGHNRATTLSFERIKNRYMRRI